MRLLCESCQQPQPPQARRGDFCVHCGQVARREARCYWCLHFTPEGKFCRKCAAATISDEWFGAARMLKDAGVDRFTIARQLGEMDPDQLDTFTSIYQQHAGVMWKHVEHLTAVQRHLVQKHWALELEQELLGQLPWPEDKLESLRLPHMGLDGEAELQWIREYSPFYKTRVLATLALAVVTGEPKVCRAAYEEGFCGGDDRVRREAALALTHWRSFFGYNPEGFAAPMLPGRARDILDELQRAGGKAARARLMMLGVDLAPELCDDLDADIAFLAALGSQQAERLANAVASRDELQCFAATVRLVEWGDGERASQGLPACSTERQYRLLKLVAGGKKPVPGLRRALFQLLGSTAHPELRRLAGQALAPDCSPQDAAEIYRLAGEHREVVQSLLQRGNLPSPALFDVCSSMVASGSFSADQWGMDAIAEPGRMPANFVPKAFVNAGGEMRQQLLRFAEKQMKKGDAGVLRTFVVSVAFGHFGPEPLPEAWAVLERTQPRNGFSREDPVQLSSDFANQHFQSLEGMLRALTRLLGLTEAVSHYSVRDNLGRLLRYAEDGIAHQIARHAKEAQLLEKALVQAAENEQLDRSLRGDCVLFLGAMAEAPACRTRIRATLTRLDKTALKASTSLALERLDRLEAAAAAGS